MPALRGSPAVPPGERPRVAYGEPVAPYIAEPLIREAIDRFIKGTSKLVRDETALVSLRSSEAPKDERDVDRNIRILGRRDDVTGLRREPLEIDLAARIPKHVDDIFL